MNQMNQIAHMMSNPFYESQQNDVQYEFESPLNVLFGMVPINQQSSKQELYELISEPIAKPATEPVQNTQTELPLNTENQSILDGLISAIIKEINDIANGSGSGSGSDLASSSSTDSKPKSSYNPYSDVDSDSSSDSESDSESDEVNKTKNITTRSNGSNANNKNPELHIFDSFLNALTGVITNSNTNIGQTEFYRNDNHYDLDIWFPFDMQKDSIVELCKDLKITVDNGYVSVFSKKYAIPEYADPSTLSVTFNNGRITLTFQTKF
jgi:HSP20 family molecular chaperone IbpA